jgi:hypothetical protein
VNDAPIGFAALSSARYPDDVHAEADDARLVGMIDAGTSQD